MWILVCLSHFLMSFNYWNLFSFFFNFTFASLFLCSHSWIRTSFNNHSNQEIFYILFPAFSWNHFIINSFFNDLLLSFTIIFHQSLQAVKMKLIWQVLAKGFENIYILVLLYLSCCDVFSGWFYIFASLCTC